jgi:hypothetical protein
LDFDSGGQDCRHGAAFEARCGFHRGQVGDRFDDGVDLALRGFRVSDFSAAEADGELHLVALFEEPAHVFGLEIEIVIVGLRAELDLLERDLRLPFAGVGLPLLLFVLELAEVLNPEPSDELRRCSRRPTFRRRLR